MEAERLYTAEQFAQILGVSKSKAYTMMQRRLIPTIRIGKNVRVRIEDLEEFILTHRDSGARSENK